MVVAVENGIYSCCRAQASGTFPDPSFRPRLIPQLSVSVINLAVSHERGAGTQGYLNVVHRGRTRYNPLGTGATLVY